MSRFITPTRIAAFFLLLLAAVPGARRADAQNDGRGRVIQIEALKVEGRIQKPEAFYILQRSELNFKGLEPKKSFIPLILKSVERDPF